MPGPKGLSERIAQPKTQPKSAATSKTTNGGSSTRGRGKGRGGRNARPAKKTAEELDSEMADYFGGEAPNANENAAAPTNGATNGDAMDEEVLV